MLSLQKGDSANGEELSRWLFEELKKLYGENGYIQYTAEVTPEFSQASHKSVGIVDLQVNIDEGKRFRLFRVRFVGDVLEENTLREAMLLHDGDVYSQTLFEKSIDRLNDTGLFESIDKDKDADFRTNEEEGLVDIVIKLTKRQN